MLTIFLYQGETNPNDIILSDPTVIRSGASSIIAAIFGHSLLESILRGAGTLFSDIEGETYCGGVPTVPVPAVSQLSQFEPLRVTTIMRAPGIWDVTVTVGSGSVLAIALGSTSVTLRFYGSEKNAIAQMRRFANHQLGLD